MRELDYKKIIERITLWISKFTEKAGTEGVIVGLSGGIDSSVTAVLCLKALGKENVIGVIMPCNSFGDDLEDTMNLVDKFNLRYFKFELGNVYHTFLNTINSEIPENKLAMGNIKPRLRMTTLYYVNQSLGNHLVAGTGNKSEILIGYFTKYGDGGVDFEPIGDFYKHEVRKIAEMLEIPNKIINKPPSAGLWKGQTDEDEIGIDYDTLDNILYHIEMGLDLSEYKSENVKKVQKMIKNSRHKRQVPPIFEIN